MFMTWASITYVRQSPKTIKKKTDKFDIKIRNFITIKIYNNRLR